MVPSVTCKRISMAINTLKGSDFNTVLSFALTMVTFVGFAVVMGKMGDEKMVYGGKNGCFVCNCTDGGVLQCPT